MRGEIQRQCALSVGKKNDPQRGEMHGIFSTSEALVVLTKATFIDNRANHNRQYAPNSTSQRHNRERTNRAIFDHLSSNDPKSEKSVGCGLGLYTNTHTRTHTNLEVDVYVVLHLSGGDTEGLRCHQGVVCQKPRQTVGVPWVDVVKFVTPTLVCSRHLVRLIVSEKAHAHVGHLTLDGRSWAKGKQGGTTTVCCFRILIYFCARCI